MWHFVDPPPPLSVTHYLNGPSYLFSLIWRENGEYSGSLFVKKLKLKQKYPHFFHGVCWPTIFIIMTMFCAKKFTSIIQAFYKALPRKLGGCHTSSFDNQYYKYKDIWRLWNVEWDILCMCKIVLLTIKKIFYP